jgi:hypothetical protein
MGKKGFEPPTLRLSGVYSYQLSYLPLSFSQKEKKKLCPKIQKTELKVELNRVSVV